MLLNAYGFGKMGEIAGIASTFAYIGAGLLLVLSGFGFVTCAGPLRRPRSSRGSRLASRPTPADEPSASDRHNRH